MPMMRLMVTLSLLMNVAVLLPVCAGLLTDAPKRHSGTLSSQGAVPAGEFRRSASYEPLPSLASPSARPTIAEVPMADVSFADCGGRVQHWPPQPF